MSIVAHQELKEHQTKLHGIAPSNHHDSWILQGSNATYSTKQVYRELICTHETHSAISRQSEDLQLA
jgi:hypothetical protein